VTTVAATPAAPSPSAPAGGTVARSGGVLVAAKVVSLLLQVGHLAILARTLDRPTFGAFAAGLALVTIVGAVAEMGLLNATMLSLSGAGDRALTMRSSRAATVRVVGLATVVVVALGVALLRGDARLAALALVPWLVLSRVDVPLVAYQQVRFAAGRLAAAEVGSRLLLVVAAVPIAVAGSGWSRQVVLLVVAAGYALSELPSLAILAKGAPWRGRADRAATRELARRALPLGLTNASSLVHARGDQVLLDTFGRRSSLAAYALAYRVNDAVLALAHAAGLVTFPALAQAGPSDRVRLGRRIVALGCVAGLAAAAASFFMAPAVVGWLGGGRYDDAQLLVRLLAAALAASVANLPVAQLAIVGGRTAQLLTISVGAVVLNLALNVALIPSFGARGSAVATVVTETAGLVAVAVVADRALPGSIPWPAIAALPVAFLATALVSVAVG
jgi:O-antigen/teichoic acid export membrane protein